MEGKTSDGPFLWYQVDERPHFEMNIYSDLGDSYTFPLRLRHFLSASLFVTHVPVIVANIENITELFVHVLFFVVYFKKPLQQ
jgi:hypothetical protein